VVTTIGRLAEAIVAMQDPQRHFVWVWLVVNKLVVLLEQTAVAMLQGIEEAKKETGLTTSGSEEGTVVVTYACCLSATLTVGVNQGKLDAIAATEQRWVCSLQASGKLWNGTEHLT